MEKSVLAEKMPSKRLVTHNMLISATSLLDETTNHRWATVQDLSALIDLFCLYDKVSFIGRTEDLERYSMYSELIGLLNDAHFIEVVTLDADAISATARVASGHLALFLGDKRIDEYEQLLSHALDSEARYLTYVPDEERNVNTGITWLRAAPGRKGLLKQLKREQREGRQGAMFVVRTFLYMAYSDRFRVAFSPDAVRCPIIESVIDVEEQFRGKLLHEVNAAWKKTIPGDKTLLQRVSPFAAVAFTRVGKDKKRLIPVIQELRNELAKDRKHLRQIEEKALWTNVDEAQKAMADWNQAVSTAAKRFEPISLLSVATQLGLSVAEAVGEVADNPAKVGAAVKLAGTLANLPPTRRRFTIGLRAGQRRTRRVCDRSKWVTGPSA